MSSMIGHTKGTIEGLKGIFRGHIVINDIKVDITRDFYFDRDIDGSITAMCLYPEDRDAQGFYDKGDPSGYIRVTDPAVCAFIDQFMQLMARPIAFDTEPDRIRQRAA